MTLSRSRRQEQKGTPLRLEKGEEPNSMLIDVFSSKLGLNVDSPSFTPYSLVVNGNHPPPKSSRLSPKAVNAAPFKPKGSTPGILWYLSLDMNMFDTFLAPTAPIFTPSAKPYNPSAPDWVAPDVQDFVQQPYDNLAIVSVDPFDTFRLQSVTFLGVLFRSIGTRSTVNSTSIFQHRASSIPQIRQRIGRAGQNYEYGFDIL